MRKLIKYLLFTGLFLFANMANGQNELKDRIQLIDQLINDGEIIEAIEEAKNTKVFVYENFKNSNRKKEAILVRLDFCYNIMNDYENELIINIERSRIRNEDLKEEQGYFDKTFKSISENYLNYKDPNKIILNFKKSNETLIDVTEQIFRKRFEGERAMFLKTNILPFFNLFQSYAYNTKYKHEGLNDLVTNNVLMIKGALLNSSKDILKNLEKLKNKTINKKIKEYRQIKNFITFQTSLNKENRSKKLDIMKGRLISLESELVIYYKRNFPKKLALKSNWRRTQLRDNEVSIEFSRFNYFNNKWTDSVLYVAHILKKNSTTPKVVYLFEEKDLENVLKNSSQTTMNSSRGSLGKSFNKKSTTDLYNLIIKPIEEEIKGSSKIYFSPDGILYQIAFASLIDNKGKLLIENYDLIQVNSSKGIKTVASQPKSKNALFIGGIDYDYSIQGKSIVNKSTITTTNNNGEIDRWTYLKGTKEEVLDLKKIFDSYEKTSNILSEKDANENAVKKLSGKSPNILHIATHGYFYKKSNRDTTVNKNEYEKSDNPLLRSGLIFAGANYAWQNGSNTYETEDGILTALEISNLDLSNTDLVALSACETGLGDITDNEGVYGLQRAFKMAGVKMIIMSLWEVPDKETAEFMTSFYEVWLKNNSIRQAFIKTQRKMHKLYPNNPEKWAAFIMVE